MSLRELAEAEYDRLWKLAHKSRSEFEAAIDDFLRIEEAARALVDDGYDHPDGCNCDRHAALREALEAPHVE